jgi:transposase
MRLRPDRRLEGITERKPSCPETEARRPDMANGMEEGTERLDVGVDLHKTQVTICVLADGDEERPVEEKAYVTRGHDGLGQLAARLHGLQEAYGCPVRLAVETTGNARYFKNRFEKEGFAVTVVNTNRFKVISESTSKNDRNDARTLAYYLYKDMLPQSHLCDQQSEEARRLLKARSILVSTQVKVKNQVHGMMLGYGVDTRHSQLQSKRKRQGLLKDLEDHGFTQTAAASLKLLFGIIDDLAEQIKAVEKQLAETAGENEDVALLRTVPGIGAVTAMTIAAYAGDLQGRFGGDFRKFASYAGLVPSVHNSNDTVLLGRITKHGPQMLRTALVQATMGMLRLSKKTGSWRLMVAYRRMKETKGSGKSIIATTRKLARVIFAILNSRRPFDESLMVREVGGSLSAEEVIGA